MRLAETLQEAGRDLGSGTARTALLALLFALTAGGATVTDVRTLRLAQDQVAGWQHAGGGVVTFSATGAIDGRACQALSRVDGVLAAGALRESAGGLRAAQLGARTIPHYEVTPGLPAMLDVRRPATAERSGPAVILSDAAAEVIGRRAGGVFEADGGTVTVAGIVTQPADGQVTPFDFSAISLVPATGAFDACWLAVWPPSEQLSHLVRSTLSAGPAAADVQTEYRPLNPRIAATLDPPALYSGRPTRWAPVAVVVSAFMLGFIALTLRRLEISSALHARIRRRDLLIQHAAEAAAWSGLGCVLVIPCVILARLGSGSGPAAVDLHAVVLLSAGFVSAVLGTISAAFLIREDHLMDYFKKR